MKKYLNIILTLSLLIFSFYYTHIVSNYIKGKDHVMQEILKNKTKFEEAPVDAYIEGNSIIPGKSGKTVDIDKSYKNMKRVNKYIESLYIYNYNKPNISLNGNFDKLIISGNKSSKNISILLKINDLDILKKLKNNSLNFILDINFINDNLNYVKTISNNIIVLEQTNLNNLDLINYCYSENTFKAYCSSYFKYTVKGELITNDYFYNTYKILNNGVIIIYDIKTQNNINDLNIVISYIKSLKYNIVSLDELIKE